MSAEPSALKSRISEDMKLAMRAGDKPKLATIRLILSAIKQVEVDSRSDVSDDDIIALLDKMQKQRRESISQYDKAGRTDLSDIEKQEMLVIQEYLPAQLTSEELDNLISKAIESTGASSMKDMGKVMGQLRPQLQGRADMGAVSASIKARLNS
ncbi:MAG: GatB/YqeY domain-containing protein [bacterium]